MKNKPPRCSVCKKPVVEEYRPFCSKRCADIDLGRWLNESYAIEASEGSDVESEYEDVESDL